MFYLLKDEEGYLFAGFKQGEKMGQFDASFVVPSKDRCTTVVILHETDIEAAEADLKKKGCIVSRIPIPIDN